MERYGKQLARQPSPLSITLGNNDTSRMASDRGFYPRYQADLWAPRPDWRERAERQREETLRQVFVRAQEDSPTTR
ncbi:MAG: hypothetical protein HY319_32760 [Armatimonadetes bacterium]|nr:hypothetical protein [Armatimonadota bacterium]